MPEINDSFQAELQSALGGQYTIERELQGRGMSRVFVAHEVALNRRVVIKTLAPDSSASVDAERFRREIVLAASLQQANIVPVHAAGQMTGLPYYIMPYVEGESLRSYLSAKGPLPVHEAVGILRDVARALTFAHSRGVVHRDIKPDNVLLSGSTAVVTDFGIAKAIEAASTSPDTGAITQIGVAIGTPTYMSPEQASGDPDVDFRADIYAMGILAYELLTGAPPFTSQSTRALLAAHIARTPADITVARSDVPPALAGLVMQCLQKDPARRPQSAQRILAELESLTALQFEAQQLPPDNRSRRRAVASSPRGADGGRDGAHAAGSIAPLRTRDLRTDAPPPKPIALPEREPPRGGVWPADTLRQPGLELLRSFLAGNLPHPPIAALTGLRLTEVGLGMATAAMPASGWWQSGAGVFLAGTIAFVADLPLSAAVVTSAPGDTPVTSSHLSVSFLRPATIGSQHFVGRGRLVHSTRSLGLSEALIQDGHGRLLGHATSRCVLVRDRTGLAPTPPAPATGSQLPDPYLRPVEGDVLGQEDWDETPGLEVVRRIAAGRLRPPVMLLFDFRGADAREGEFVMTMPPSPWLCNAFGTVYGGALALFADVAMTLAVGSTMPPASAYSPLDMTVHFLRPVFPDAPSSELTARGRVTHRGRTIAVTTCEIMDSTGRLLAQASGSTLILPGRPWQRPVNVGEEITQDGVGAAT